MHLRIFIVKIYICYSHLIPLCIATFAAHKGIFISLGCDGELMVENIFFIYS